MNKHKWRRYYLFLLRSKYTLSFSIMQNILDKIILYFLKRNMNYISLLK